MKQHALRQERTIIVVSAGVFAVGLIAVSAVSPEAFGIVVALAGAVGALVVLYEVRQTKRISQAECVRDLQSGFSTDPNICQLWSKLLLKEEVTAADRPLVSSYLTFFETLHLLLQREALDLSLTDDLFRNRFFTAIGNKGILETALIREAGSFANIHDLIQTWHDYLLDHGIPIHPGYYAYIRALAEKKGYKVDDLGPDDFADLKNLQEEVLAALRGRDWLRANDDVMLRACLTEHLTLGVRKDGELVGAAVLFDAGETPENLARYVQKVPAGRSRSVNLKLVLVSPQHRRAGLGRTLVELLELKASELQKAEILCTIHHENEPSKDLFKLLGYKYATHVDTPYGERDLFARSLPSLNKSWAR